MSFVVAVDGPAGSGKGTITKRIEQEMGLINLDTGATYRCVALETLRHGYDASQEEKIVELLDNIDIQIENEGKEDVIFLNGEDVSKEIRETPVTAIVSQISSIIPVREKMVILQRKLAEGKNVIVEGRDIGTVVFPDADIKIYLDATPEERAMRRFKQNQENGIDIPFEEILKNVKERDYIDSHREIAPLTKAPDAIYIDSTGMTIEEEAEAVMKVIKEKQKENWPNPHMILKKWL